jgi:hypothetical protein
MVGRTPLNRPKFDSRPQMDTITRADTPYSELTRRSNASCFAAMRRAVRTNGRVSLRATY